MNAKHTPTNTTESPWKSMREAATQIGVPEITLRRSIERNARRGASGTIEAAVDGVFARKFGRRWRVRLDAGWTATSQAR